MCKSSVLSIIRRCRSSVPAETFGQRSIFRRAGPIFRVKYLAARAIQHRIELSVPGAKVLVGSRLRVSASVPVSSLHPLLLQRTVT
jgi:hypothetical protein